MPGAVITFPSCSGALKYARYSRTALSTAAWNVFWMAGGRLFTPSLDCGCLPGSARATVLRLAAAQGLLTTEGAFAPAGLASADEAFLTNSVVEVCPLVVLDGRPVGSGHPGPVSRTLQQSYKGLVSKETGAQL